MLDVMEYALHAIASIVGLEDWSYPGQVVLEVQKLANRVKELEEKKGKADGAD